MNLQGRDLKRKHRGEDVRLLHTELRKLGFRIPAQEYTQRNFGPVTQSAVRAFQTRHNLSPTGVVDEATAGASMRRRMPLNRRLLYRFRGRCGSQTSARSPERMSERSTRTCAARSF